MNHLHTVRPHSGDNMRGIVKNNHDYERLDKAGIRQDLMPTRILVQEQLTKEQGPCRRCCASICRCVRLFLCGILVIGIIIGSIGFYSGFKFVQTPGRQIDTLVDCGLSRNVSRACGDGLGNAWTPANVTQSIDFPACMLGSLKDAMVKFNAEHDWKLVSFPSRQGKSGQEKVFLKAWWLPVKDPKAARVIVVHGNNANFNHFSVQTVAYLLRSIGFAVLLPNLRDHGTSGSSLHRFNGWGWDYHLDVLGAWDYAVHDPYGVLGGKQAENRIGIMGFGVGAFATSIALGEESQIPAVWLDSAILRPREFLRSQLSQIVGPFAPVFTGMAWKLASLIAGVNITHVTPEGVLSRQLHHRESRFVALSHNRLDTRVLPNQADEFLALFAQLSSYRIEETYLPHARGCGNDGHSILPIWRPGVFRRKMCEFWSGVFGRFANECRLDELPKFDNVLDIASLGEQAEDRRLVDALREALIVS